MKRILPTDLEIAKEEARRDRSIVVRVTPRDLEQIDAVAAAMKCSRSRTVRTLIRAAWAKLATEGKL